MRNPETAYLVSNEEFDKQIDELGWSAKRTSPRWAACTSKEACTISERMCGILCGRYWSCCLLPAALLIDTLRTFFLIVLFHTRPDSLAISVWDGVSKYAFTMDVPLRYRYTWLPVSDLFPVAYWRRYRC